MESIRKLREICQGPRKESDSWHMRTIARKPSIYLTWLLLHTPLTANGATFIFVIVGLLVSFIFTFGTKWSFLAGALLLQLWYVIDMVDGEIARYRKQSSVTGVFFDCITHYIVHPFVFVCIGIGLSNTHNNIAYLLVSVLAGYSVLMITALSDVYNNVLYLKISDQLLTRSHVRGESIKVNAGDDIDNGPGIAKKVFSVVHLISTFPSIMNIILIAAVINIFTKCDIFVFLMFFYAITSTLVWVARLIVFIKSKKIDSEIASIQQQTK